MKLNHPRSGQSFDIGASIQFDGAAPKGTERVTFTADGKFPLDDGVLLPTPLPSGEISFSLARRFLGKGTRSITAMALDGNGKSLGSTLVTIVIDIPRIGNYVPPLASLDVLNDILRQLEDARTVRKINAFQGNKALFKLPGGELYMDSDLDLDTDGSLVGTDESHQSQTSIHEMDGKTPLDANKVAYYVLPNPGSGKGGAFFHDLGMSWGDIAAIVFGDQVSFAFFADGGPQEKVGEASIQVHRELGTLRTRNGRILDVGVDRDVITVLFPGSGRDLVANRKLTKPLAEVQRIVASRGRELFIKAGGNLS